jgi:hypothetical protein
MTPFDTHCPTCCQHRNAIARAEMSRDDRAVRLHISLQEAHWRKEHDQGWLASLLFGKRVRIGN